MKIISIDSLVIPDVKVLKFERFSDNRGFFTEPFRRSDFDSHSEMSFLSGIPFVQQNESYSKKHVLRGLHFQWNPQMGKLVRTLNGHMVDIFCDIRKGSPTFGKVAMHNMQSDSSFKSGEWIWVPPGFAHGNLFLQETLIEYMCTGEYSKDCEAGISPLSDDLDWELCDKNLLKHLYNSSVQLIISEKDKAGLSLSSWIEDSRSDNFIFNKL